VLIVAVAGSHSLKLLRYTDVTILYTGTLCVTLRETGYLLQVTGKIIIKLMMDENFILTGNCV